MRIFNRYLLHTALAFGGILLVYLVGLSIFQDANALLQNHSFLVPSIVFGILFFTGWAIMLPVIKKNPKELFVGAITLTIVQMLEFMAFLLVAIIYELPRFVLYHVLWLFLCLILIQVLCIIKALNEELI
jgi:hypothetical protein